jgi:hypothetical protein
MQGERNVRTVSSGDLAKFYDHYADVFLKKLEGAFGRNALGAGIEKLSREDAARITPNLAELSGNLRKMIEGRLYNSGRSLMLSKKYYRLLRSTLKELTKQLEKADSRAFSPGGKQKAIRDALSEIIVRTERKRMIKMLSGFGLEKAWGRFMSITLAVAENHHSIPELNRANLNPAVRKAAVASENHTDFFMKMLGAENNRELRRNLLVDLHSSDIHYLGVRAAQGSKSKLLTPMERALINVSLRLKMVPKNLGISSGATTIFSLEENKAYVSKLGSMSMEAVSDLIALGPEVKTAMRKFLLSKRSVRALLSKAEEKAVAEVSSAARRGATEAGASRARGGGSWKVAAGIAIGALAYHLIVNTDTDKLPDNILGGEGAPPARAGLSSTPRKREVQEELNAALNEIAPFSVNKGNIEKMLNSIKVRGKKLTQEEKLRALRIAALRKGYYKGEEMERYAKIAAIVQFTPSQGDESVALLSEEIKELVPPKDQEKASREVAGAAEKAPAPVPKGGKAQVREAAREAVGNPGVIVDAAREEFEAAKRKLMKLRRSLGRK